MLVVQNHKDFVHIQKLFSFIEETLVNFPQNYFCPDWDENCIKTNLHLLTKLNDKAPFNIIICGFAF